MATVTQADGGTGNGSGGKLAAILGKLKASGAVNVPHIPTSGRSITIKTSLPLAFFFALFIANLPNWKFRLNNAKSNLAQVPLLANKGSGEITALARCGGTEMDRRFCCSRLSPPQRPLSEDARNSGGSSKRTLTPPPLQMKAPIVSLSRLLQIRVRFKEAVGGRSCRLWFCSASSVPSCRVRRCCQRLAALRRLHRLLRSQTKATPAANSCLSGHQVVYLV